MRERARDAGLLILRLLVGGTMLFGHGLPKLLNWSERVANFPDPLGVGSTVSLALAIFGEVLCAAAVLVGLATRYASAVVIINMLVAFFVVLSGEPFAKRELAMMFGIGFLVLVLTGAGKFSMDQILFAGKPRASLKLDV
jgi:putative oxidoreductase